MLYKNQSLYRVSAKKEHNRRGGRGVDIIKEEQAELLRLQAEILEQYFAGDIKLEHIRWFNDLTLPERDKLVAKRGSVSQPSAQVVHGGFALLANLGIITVPKDYDHNKCIELYLEKIYEEGGVWNPAMTDVNFSNPSHVLMRGEQLYVKVFTSILSGNETAEECVGFLEKQKGNVFLGAQGIALVFKQARHLLPQGAWIASLDKNDRLFTDAKNSVRIPLVCVFSQSNIIISLGLGSICKTFFCFSEVE